MLSHCPALVRIICQRGLLSPQWLNGVHLETGHYKIKLEVWRHFEVRYLFVGPEKVMEQMRKVYGIQNKIYLIYIISQDCPLCLS